MFKRLYQFLLLVFVAVIATPTGSARADGPKSEYEVKAAFIYNFARFVEWPADAFASGDAPLVIGVVGDDPFRGALDRAVKDKSVEGHALQVRHFATADDVQRCHILFVPAAVSDQTDHILQRAGSNGVLSVGETDTFTPAGGVIRFYLDDNKIHFEVNLDAAEQARLKLSAKLLKLARIYRK